MFSYMSGIGEFIKEKRKAIGYSKWRLYQESGVSYPYITQLESGERENPAPEYIKKLSEALRVPYLDMMAAAGYIEQSTLDALRSGKGEVRIVEVEDLPAVKVKKLPLFDLAVCAGDGGMFDDSFASEHVAWNAACDFVITVSGKSMEPKLPDGVKAGIKRCTTPMPKKMMLVTYQDENGNSHNAIKYVDVKGDAIHLKSENSAFQTVVPAENVSIVGYVVDFKGEV